MSAVWHVVAAGVALGPELVFMLDGGRRAVLSAIWTDEDGVCVNVDAGDEPLPAGLAGRVASGLLELAAVPAPVLAEIRAS